LAVEADTIRRAEERVGSLLNGKYRLERVLGIGGMAVVYAATHRNQKQFAVKMLHAELSIREGIRARFLREGYAANSVKHSGAVAVMDDDIAKDGAAFLVMELLEGSSVEELWNKYDRKLPLSCALAIGHELLDVLAAAHAKGIVHRDIKPANLFLTHEGQLKVLDFGIARVRDVAASGADGTGTGMLLGTPAFMAPEQAIAKASEIDAQTDVWAVGATLFALLGGEFVHTGDNAAHILVTAATTPARSLAALSPESPAAVVEVVDRALAFYKSQRWLSAIAMRDAIREAHLAVFGRIVSRDSLLPLVRGRSPEGAAAQQTEIPTTVPPTTFAQSPRPQTTAPMPGPAESVVLNVARMEGPTTTSQAVSSARRPVVAATVGIRKVTFVAVASVIVVALLGGTTVGVQSLFRAAPTAAAPQPMQLVVPPKPSSPKTVVLATLPPAGPTAPSPTPPGEALSPTTDTSIAAAAFDGGSAIPLVDFSQLKPSANPPAPTKPLLRPVPSEPSSAGRITKLVAPAKPTTPNCNPNFVYDAEGNKVFKPECFVTGAKSGDGF
jgi:serine/threonine-protein kinase